MPGMLYRYGRRCPGSEQVALVVRVEMGLAIDDGRLSTTDEGGAVPDCALGDLGKSGDDSPARLCRNLGKARERRAVDRFCQGADRFAGAIAGDRELGGDQEVGSARRRLARGLT